jgi:ATP-dependent Lon protease
MHYTWLACSLQPSALSTLTNWVGSSFFIRSKKQLTCSLEFLTGTDADTRLISATKLLVKQNSISEVSQKIASDVNETLSKQQKEFYLRQQLAAIQRELQQLQGTGANMRLLPGSSGSKTPSELDDDSQQDQEELDDMRCKIEALEKDSEERKVCVREWRRMKRTQPSSVEQGVIRSYVSIWDIPYHYHSLYLVVRSWSGLSRSLGRLHQVVPSQTTRLPILSSSRKQGSSWTRITLVSRRSKDG